MVQIREILHILTDSSITLAYYSVPVTIYAYLNRKKTLQFNTIFWLFIFSYGTAYLPHLLALWITTEWGVSKFVTPVVFVVTAAVSVTAAIFLWYLLPRILNNPTTKRLHEVNESLLEERNFVTTILDTIDAFVVVMDVKGNIVKINPSFERLIGYTTEEVLGKNLSSCFLSPGQEVTAILENLMDQGKPSRCEKQIITQQGDCYFISWSNTVLKGTDGSIKYIISTGIDITERKQAEEALLVAKEYFKDTLTDTLRQHQGIIFKLKEENGRFVFTFADGLLLNRLGYTPAQIVGKDLVDLYRLAGGSEDDARYCIQFYRRAWQEEENVRYEMIEPCGIHTLTVLNAVKAKGEVIGLIGSTTDITKEKQMAKELQESESKYRLMAENISDMLVILDPQGITQYASPSHQRILGYQPDQLVGSSRFTLLHPDDQLRMKEWFQTICQSNPSNPINQTYQAEYRLCHKNGNWVRVEARGMPILNDQGRVERIILITRDITEQKQAEEVMRKWERVSAVGELAAGIAHEIRNPLTTLKGFVQLLKRGPIKPAFLELMHSELSRIELVTNEFLMLAKPQATNYQSQDLTLILESVITVLNTQAIMSNTHIRMEIKIGRPMINGDINHLKQVFINLLKNAIEAMPEGGEIGVKVLSSDSNKVIIQFIDQGIGIPEEILPKLGEPFYSLKEKGTGLGLTISFKIIKEHQGDLHILSRIGEGTTVIVSLPLQSHYETRKMEE